MDTTLVKPTIYTIQSGLKASFHGFEVTLHYDNESAYVRKEVPCDNSPRSVDLHQRLQREAHFLVTNTGHPLLPKVYSTDANGISIEYLPPHRFHKVSDIEKVLAVIPHVHELPYPKELPPWNAEDFAAILRTRAADLLQTNLFSTQAYAMVSSISEHIPFLDWRSVGTTHGDLLLRHVLTDGNSIKIIDWEQVAERPMVSDYVACLLHYPLKRRLIIETAKMQTNLHYSQAYIQLLIFELERRMKLVQYCSEAPSNPLYKGAQKYHEAYIPFLLRKISKDLLPL